MASDAIQLQSPKDVATQYKQEMIEKARADESRQLAEFIQTLSGSDPSLTFNGLSMAAKLAVVSEMYFNVRLEDGTYTTTKLALADIVRYVGFAAERGLSVLGQDMYPTMKMINGKPRLATVGVSSEARASVAATKGLKFGPPSFTMLEREWPAAAQIAKPKWAAKDIGCKCDMNMYIVAGGEVIKDPATYTAWLSQWYAGTGSGKSYWDKNPEWMLNIRAKDKCITLASGVGQSDPQEDEPMPMSPSAVTSTEFKLTSKGEK